MMADDDGDGGGDLLTFLPSLIKQAGSRIGYRLKVLSGLSVANSPGY